MECLICNKEFSRLGHHLRKTHNIELKEYYDIFLKRPFEEFCENPYCIDKEKNEPKRTSFISIKSGYQRHCGLKCSNQNPETINRSNVTCIKKYGVINVMNNKEIKIKCRTSLRETLIDPDKKEKIVNQRNKTVKDRYNVKGVLSVPEFLDKAKKTSKKRHGKEYYAQTEEFKDIIEKLSQEKYGVNHFLSSPIILKKKEETNLKNRNVKFPGQDPKVKQKSIETNLRKRGVKYSCQDKSVAKKISKSLKGFYKDEDNRSKVKELKIKTNLERYNTEWAIQTDEVKEKSRNTSLINYRKKVEGCMKDLDLELADSNELNYVTDKVKIKCLKCGKEYINSYYNISLGHGKCPKCFPRNRPSQAENEIGEYIKELDIEIEKSCYSIIHPFQLDIIVPDKKIAIEYNGLYWHSEKFGRGNNYHIDKTNKCKEKGYRLIHIFEDEWFNKMDIVKTTIKNILNCNNSERIHARKCIIKEISPQEKNEFLDKFHILGKDSSVIKLGAFYNKELLAVMTFSHGSISRKKYSSELDWELNRFCSNYNYRIPGIASKLLTYFKRNYKWEKIYSYADLRWSQGDLYYKLGFDLINQTLPDYWYFDGINIKRFHRFALRKKPDEPKDKTEWELRLKEGYVRVFDCGKLKFMTKNKVWYRT